MVLEHEILKALYTKASFTVTGQGSEKSGITPLYKRDYTSFSLHFGTLAYAIYNPNTNLRKDNSEMNVRNIIKKKEDVNISEDEWFKLSDAIEILVYEKDITDSGAEDIFDVNNRIISLTHKGAMNFRKKYYIKENEKELLEDISINLTKLEYSAKKHWLRNEIIKNVVTTVSGALVGALIALISTQWVQKSKEQSNTQKSIISNTKIVPQTSKSDSSGKK